MLTAVLLAVLATPSPRQPLVSEEEKEREAADAEEEEALELEREERRERWDADRDFKLVARAGARVGFDPFGEDLFGDASVELGLGFSQRIASRHAVQGNVSLATGFAKGIDEEIAPLIDGTADVTFRIGSSRVYFGLGPIARFWSVFGEGEPLRLGGGVIGELGFLLGDDRALDLVFRVHAGLFRLEGKWDFWIAETFGIGWHF